MRGIGSFLSDGDGTPLKDIYLIVNPSGKEFHPHYEQVRGDRTSLLNFSGGFKKLIFLSINKNRDERGENTRHDKGIKPMRTLNK